MEHKVKKTEDCYVCENCHVASGDGDGIYNFAQKKRPCVGQKLGFTDYALSDDDRMDGTVYTFDVELRDGKPVAIGGGKEFEIEDLMQYKGAQIIEDTPLQD